MPLGDKVISGGIYGSALVSTMLVRKYDHGMTLHRQREEMLRLRPGNSERVGVRSDPLGDGPVVSA